MPSKFVERIKNVKDRVLSLLDAIKEEQSEFKDLVNRRLGAIDESKDKHHDETMAVLAGIQKQLSALMPVHDRYSYPDEVETYRRSNPEVVLLQHLRTFLPTITALDIGANVGDVSEQLLAAGYRVFAFEPQPEAFERLAARFQGVKAFRAMPIAVGAADRTAQLHSVSIAGIAGESELFNDDLSVYGTLVQHPMPESMNYGQSIEVSVRSLKSLHEQAELPRDVSLVKIDTEGGDIDVIVGMGGDKYPVVMAEFWDASHYFSQGQAGLLKPLVELMRQKGYNWHLVIYRIFDGVESTEPRFFCNLDQSVQGSWGNVIFFRDFEVFREGQRWCSAVMPFNAFR